MTPFYKVDITLLFMDFFFYLHMASNIGPMVSQVI